MKAETPRVKDLMEALEESLAEAKAESVVGESARREAAGKAGSGAPQPAPAIGTNSPATLTNVSTAAKIEKIRRDATIAGSVRGSNALFLIHQIEWLRADIERLRAEVEELRGLG